MSESEFDTLINAYLIVAHKAIPLIAATDEVKEQAAHRLLAEHPDCFPEMFEGWAKQVRIDFINIANGCLSAQQIALTADRYLEELRVAIKCMKFFRNKLFPECALATVSDLTP